MVAQLGDPLDRYVVERRGRDDGEADEEDVGHSVAELDVTNMMGEGIGVPERAQTVVVLLPRSVPGRSVTKKHRGKGVVHHSSRSMGLPPAVALTVCGSIMLLM